MSAAYNYIMRRQKENGCFRLEGAVHNYRLLVGCGGGGLPGDTLLRVCCWFIGCQYTAYNESGRSVCLCRTCAWLGSGKLYILHQFKFLTQFASIQSIQLIENLDWIETFGILFEVFFLDSVVFQIVILFSSTYVLSIYVCNKTRYTLRITIVRKYIFVNQLLSMVHGLHFVIILYVAHVWLLCCGCLLLPCYP